jgi:hypothetical protein
MRTALLKRLKRLEEVRVVETQPTVEFQIGYVKRLPHEYADERHIVTVGARRTARIGGRSDEVRRQPVKSTPRRSSESSWCERRMDDRTIRGAPEPRWETAGDIDPYQGLAAEFGFPVATSGVSGPSRHLVPRANLRIRRPVPATWLITSCKALAWLSSPCVRPETGV